MIDPWLAKMAAQTPEQRAAGERLVCRDCRMMRLFQMSMWMCTEGHMVGFQTSDGRTPSFVSAQGFSARLLADEERAALGGWMENRYD